MANIITLKHTVPYREIYVNVDNIAYFSGQLDGDLLGTEVYFNAASAQRLASIMVAESPTEVLAMIKGALGT
jgi:hypothetical protein